MGRTYSEGRQEALDALGIRTRASDNTQVSSFIQRLPEDHRTPKKGPGDRFGPLNRQAWGKAQTASTSADDFSGGGVRR